jgi:hypothetical protein
MSDMGQTRRSNTADSHGRNAVDCGRPRTRSARRHFHAETEARESASPAGDGEVAASGRRPGVTTRTLKGQFDSGPDISSSGMFDRAVRDYRKKPCHGIRTRAGQGFYVARVLSISHPTIEPGLCLERLSDCRRLNTPPVESCCLGTLLLGSDSADHARQSAGSLEPEDSGTARGRCQYSLYDSHSESC